jgi:hypothetical protein
MKISIYTWSLIIANRKGINFVESSFFKSFKMLDSKRIAYLKLKNLAIQRLGLEKGNFININKSANIQVLKLLNLRFKFDFNLIS